MEYPYLHEIEFVEIPSVVHRPLSELPRVFKSLGFTLRDDVVSLDRTGKVPPWQHSSIVEVKVRHDDEEVFGFEGQWDSIRLEYLYATLPHELTERFIDAAFAVGRSLSLPIQLEGVQTDAAALRQHFEKCRDELWSEIRERPGSEELAILIRSTYPRRRP